MKKILCVLLSCVVGYGLFYVEGQEISKKEWPIEYNVPQGIGFEHVVEYANGFKRITYYAPCSACFGRQVCIVCNGKGVIAAYWPTTHYVLCDACKGKKFCTICHATNGYIVAAVYSRTPEGLMQDFVSFVDTGNHSNQNSYTTATDNKGCDKCGGTGIDPFPHDDKINFASYNSKLLIGYQHLDKSKICPYCKNGHKEFGYHYHIKCLSCNGL